MSTYPPAILQFAYPISITDVILLKHVTSTTCQWEATVHGSSTPEIWILLQSPFKVTVPQL